MLILDLLSQLITKLFVVMHLEVMGIGICPKLDILLFRPIVPAADALRNEWDAPKVMLLPS